MYRFKIIAGPCVIENKDISFFIAERLKKIAEKYNLKLIFKGSYKKANRTKLNSFSTIGEEKALKILKEVSEEFELPVLTDIHESKDASFVSHFVDYLQIPAFLCRQTELLIAAGKTKKGINIKKGQFISPEMMKFAVEKVLFANPNAEIMLSERGTTFGYNNLIVDFTSFPIMNKFADTIMDCTHSIQRPNQSSGVTGGNPEMIGTLAKAAMASGAKGLFIETHPNPEKSPSDAASILQIDKLENILIDCVKIYDALN